MRELDSYLTIEKTGVAEFKDRGSQFIGYAYPISSVADFKEKLAALKKKHPKATHHCFAYRLGLDSFNFRVSDDGEPSGSAGRPILGQIDSRSLTNVLIVVVRYFGGTSLGVPGLINAYKSTAAMALQVTPVVQKPIEVIYRIHFDYTKINEVMTLIKQQHCSVRQQDMQLFCVMQIGIPKANHDYCLEKLKEVQGIEIEELKMPA